MSAYLTKAEEKRLLQTYRLRGVERFHSMNAGLIWNDECVQFYSYYTKCIEYYPSVNYLLVYPIVYDDTLHLSPTTKRQIDRFLAECVTESINVNVLRFGSLYADAREFMNKPAISRYDFKGFSIFYLNEKASYLERA